MGMPSFDFPRLGLQVGQCPHVAFVWVLGIKLWFPRSSQQVLYLPTLSLALDLFSLGNKNIGSSTCSILEHKAMPYYPVTLWVAVS